MARPWVYRAISLAFAAIAPNVAVVCGMFPQMPKVLAAVICAPAVMIAILGLIFAEVAEPKGFLPRMLVVTGVICGTLICLGFVCFGIHRWVIGAGITLAPALAFAVLAKSMMIDFLSQPDGGVGAQEPVGRQDAARE